MVGALIGGGLSLLSTGIGAWQASKAAKKAKANIENQQRENEDWYNRRWNEDATQRADAQRVLTMTADNIRQRNRAAQGAAAVAGGTEESVAAEKAANNAALADATSRIAAAGDARKDAIEQQYMTNKQDLQGQLNGIEMAKAQNIAQAAGGAASAAGELGLAFDEWRDKK